MNVNSVSSQTSWAEFVRLAAQARARSSDLNSQTVHGNRSRQNAGYKTATQNHALLQRGAFDNTAKNISQKTLGCNFDAYA